MRKKVLVTGATGFLGSHLVKELLKREYSVSILKRSFSDTWRIFDVMDQVTFYDVDQNDLNSIFVDLGEVHAVIHTSTCYGKKSENAVEIFEANTLFPLKILELAVRNGTRIFINTDTYYNKKSIPYRGLPEYSLSKHQFSEWGKEYAYLKKIQFIDMKLEHVFGPHEDKSKFTTYIIQSLLRNKEEIPLTAGEQLRDFIYIKDVVSAYIIALESTYNENYYQELELGTGVAITIREFLESVLKLTRSKSILKFGDIPYRESEIMSSQANIKALKNLGWVPKYQLEDALIETIDSYKL